MKYLDIKKVKELLEEYNYYADERIVYSIFKAIFAWNNNGVNREQGIYSVCLEGPTGAGKTFYAETYTKLVKYLYGDDVYLLDYQCDATTGKSELYEDINISAAISRDASKVNIPGKLVEAVNLVNAGKRVILFLDEFEKSRLETDTFLYQFLQRGKVNAQQFGDLEIESKYMNNLQVVFCKNDNRELSEPLLRRNRIIRVDYMTPELFNKAGSNYLLNDNESMSEIYRGLFNLVLLIYNDAYAIKDKLTRLPSYSEMIIAIKDAAVIMNYANAPKNIIYNEIIEGMFKKLDDIATIKACISEDSKLKSVISSMESDTKSSISIDDMIRDSYASDIREEYNSKVLKLQEVIDKCQDAINNGSYVSNRSLSFKVGDVLMQEGDFEEEIVSNFNDSSLNIRRGVNIFDVSNKGWTEVVTLSGKDLKSGVFLEELINSSKDMKLTVYENGFSINVGSNNIGFVIARSNGKTVVRFMSSNKVMDISSLRVINSISKYIISVNNKNLSDLGISTTDKGNIDVNCLVYSDSNIMGMNMVSDNIYLMNNFYDIDSFSDYVDNGIPNKESSNYKSVIDELESSVNSRGRDSKKMMRVVR